MPLIIGFCRYFPYIYNLYQTIKTVNLYYHKKNTTMVIIIKKNSTKDAIMSLLSKLRSKKGFNAKKHCGVIKLKSDPLTIQKKMRDEWK